MAKGIQNVSKLIYAAFWFMEDEPLFVCGAKDNQPHRPGLMGC